jgi:hypothetical protein
MDHAAKIASEADIFIVSAKNFGYGSGYSGFIFARNTY